MGRLVAIDLARTAAIIGMMAAHLLAIGQDTGALFFFTSGFPSTLFAVLGGFGVVFASRRYLTAGRPGAAVLAGFVRGIMVVLIGLILELLPPHPIAVVLVYFGGAIVAGSVMILVPQLPLAIGLGVGAVAVPTLQYWVAAHCPEVAAHGSLDYSGPLPFLVTSWLTGTYPAATWIIYLGVGILVARFVLGTHNPRVRAVGVGMTGLICAAAAQVISEWRIEALATGLARRDLGAAEARQILRTEGHDTALLTGWDLLLVADPHSGSTLDLLRTAGFAVFIVAALLVIFGTASRLTTVLQPVATLGATPLTSYTLHVTMTAFALSLSGAYASEDWAQAILVLNQSFWWQVGVLLAAATALTVLKKRGPLESLVSWMASVFVPAPRSRAKSEEPGLP